MTSQLSDAVGAQAAGAIPQLRSITIQRPAMSEHGLLDYLTRDDSLVWSRHGQGTIGFGQVARFDASGPERLPWPTRGGMLLPQPPMSRIH